MSSPSIAWLPVLLIGGILVVAAGWIISARDLREQRALDAAQSERIERLERSPVETSPDPQRIVYGAAAPLSSAPQSVESVSEGLATMQRVGQQQWQATEAAFIREPRDPVWGAPKESSLLEATRDSVMKAVQRPEHMDVDCRSKQCRISAVFPDRSAAEDWAQIYIVSAGRTLPRAHMQVLPNDDGTAEVRIYGTP